MLLTSYERTLGRKSCARSELWILSLTGIHFHLNGIFELSHLDLLSQLQERAVTDRVTASG